MKLQPLTVVHDGSRFFGRYLHEILLAEGFPYTVPVDLADLGQIDPRRSPLVAFSQMSADPEQARRILSLAELGASIVLMRPGDEVLGELGITRVGTINDGYLSWEGTGPIQIHGEADLYPPVSGTRILADLRETRNGEETGPAYLIAERGQGSVALFSFNLPHSVVLTRQGNPAWRDSKGDEWKGVRPNDLFYRLSGEMWIDPENAGIPQADLLQRFLADQLVSLSPVPLPRTWYFPNMERVSFSVVADSDAATMSEVGSEAALLTFHGGVFSTYLIDSTLDSITREDIGKLSHLGHEVSIHPNYKPSRSSPTKAGMAALYGEMTVRFMDKAGFTPSTIRHHCLTWTGWVDVPKTQQGLGIKLDNNYGYPPWFGQEKYGVGPTGFITGSGQPQRFCDEDGELIDVYQLEQNLEDEILLPDKGLDITGEEASAALQAMIQRSLEGDYSHLVACFHPYTVAQNPEAHRALDSILAFCETHEIPVRTLKDIAGFAETRRSVGMEFRSSGDRLVLTVSGPREVSERGVTLLIPKRGLTRALLAGAELPTITLGGHLYYWHVPANLPVRILIPSQPTQH